MLRTLLETLTKNSTGIIVGLSTIVIFILIYLIFRSFQENDEYIPPVVSTKKKEKESKSGEAIASSEKTQNKEPSIDDSPLDDLDDLDELIGPTDSIPGEKKAGAPAADAGKAKVRGRTRPPLAQNGAAATRAHH